MAPNSLPDIAFIRECLDYDPDTGVFIWRDRPPHHFRRPYQYKLWNATFAGKPAGWTEAHLRNRYQRITITGKGLFRLHRLAWLLVYGEPVPDIIDHIDGDQTNNRIVNLRAATSSANAMNSKLRPDNTSGVKGVFRVRNNRQRYLAYINTAGHRQYLGTFDTIEEAAEARRAAAARLHGKFVNHG